MLRRTLSSISRLVVFGFIALSSVSQRYRPLNNIVIVFITLSSITTRCPLSSTRTIAYHTWYMLEAYKCFSCFFRVFSAAEQVPEQESQCPRNRRRVYMDKARYKSTMIYRPSGPSFIHSARASCRLGFR